jgi:GR25 family glycosyltransferase involved in LPS biosynthesis
MLSIIRQSYHNWHIYYTNDCSTDSTHELFWEIVTACGIENKITYIRNKENKKQACSKYAMYQLVDRKSVVIVLDGDDWLSGTHVLTELNSIYTTNDYLFVYSGYKVFNNHMSVRNYIGKDYPEECKNTASYRSHNAWLFSHLRSGYAWLFKMIPKSYLMMNNSWIDRCTDWAELYCVAELAKNRVKHIPKMFCVYNQGNSIIYENSYYNDKNGILRRQIETYVKSCPPVRIYLPPIFVISLPDDIVNRKLIVEQLSLYNITNIEIFDAHYAKNEPETVEIYQQYVKDYQRGIITDNVFGVKKIHLSIGAIGIIISTLNLYKYINQLSIDHALILEDDVYIKKDFDKYYHITNVDVLQTDLMYIGHNCENRLLLDCRKSKTNLVDLNDSFFKNIHIYGAYSYICSKKFRDHLLALGLNYFIQNNLPIDCFFVNCYKKNTIGLKIKLFHDHLFIPEVRKDGIQSKRDASFYTKRHINIDDYHNTC